MVLFCVLSVVIITIAFSLVAQFLLSLWNLLLWLLHNVYFDLNNFFVSIWVLSLCCYVCVHCTRMDWTKLLLSLWLIPKASINVKTTNIDSRKNTVAKGLKTVVCLQWRLSIHRVCEYMNLNGVHFESADIQRS